MWYVIRIDLSDMPNRNLPTFLSTTTCAWWWLTSVFLMVLGQQLRSRASKMTFKVCLRYLSSFSFLMFCIIFLLQGTITYTAPELLLHETYNELSDVYSFALVLWVILTRKTDPFPELVKLSNKDFVLQVSELFILFESPPSYFLCTDY